MRIAICDDTPADLQRLSHLLTEYGQTTASEIALDCFHSADALLQVLDQTAAYDVVFLDILMPFLNGIQAAKELRQNGGRCELIFLTSSADFALESYSVKARAYLLKPLSRETLFALMDELSVQLQAKETIVIHSKNQTHILPFDRIAYCESLRHQLVWHLRSGRILTSIETMEAAEKKLAPSRLFLRIHRSYLVNIQCIRSLDRSTHELELSSFVRLPIPRAKFTQIQELYLTKRKELSF